MTLFQIPSVIYEENCIIVDIQFKKAILGMRIFVFIFIIILFPLSVFAQKNITGYIQDSESNEALSGAIVRIEGTSFGAKTNAKGRFQLKNIPKTEHTVLISLIGYSSKKIVIPIEIDSINVTLEQIPLQTNEVVVSANKKVQAVQDVPISVSVLDQRGLQDRNITRLDDALRYVPGVNIARDQISIRGSSGLAFGVGSRVSMLLDGFSLLSGDNGDIKLDILPMVDIEQIEIVKGAGSALYGTGALGGVVNIITQEPEEKAKIKFRGYTGFYFQPPFEQWKYRESLPMQNGFDLGYSQKFGDLGVLMTVGAKQNDSYRDYDDQNRQSFFGKVTYSPSNRTQIGLISLFAVEDRTDWVYWNSLDSATLPPTATDRSIRLNAPKLMLGTYWKQIFSDATFMTARVSLFRTSFTTSHPITSPDYRSSISNSLTSEIQMNTQFSSDFNLTYGIWGQQNDVESSIYSDKRQRFVAGYSQAEYKPISTVTLTGGIRADYEQTDTLESTVQLSPKFGATWSASSDLTFRTSFGRGFRAAMVAERYAATRVGPFTVVPNVGLNPEFSFSSEIGVNYKTQIGLIPFFIDFSFFENRLDQLIEPRLEANGIRFTNITNARILGSELSIKTLLSRYLGIESSVTVMDPKDLIVNTTLPFRPNVLWYTRFLVPINEFEFQADYRFISRFETIDERIVQLGVIQDAEARVPIHVVDARVIWRPKSLIDIPFSATLNLNNAFNYVYTEVIGNLGPTRNMTLQVNMEL